MSGYRAASSLFDEQDGRHLDLETALGLTPQGLVENPTFFQGFLARPHVAAAAMLTVADVAASRYADAGLVQRIAILAGLDPVVTASGDRLRFEAFSACNGVHARFDLLSAGVDSGSMGFGTTNIDINHPLRTALAGVGRAELMHLSVGHDELRIASPDETHIERKVSLPDRWVRGFAELPALTREMVPGPELRGTAIASFIGSLPRVPPPGPTYQALLGRGAARLSVTRLPGSVPISGTSRLRAANRIARFALVLRSYSGPNGTSAWVFELPGGRLTLTLSPDPFRAFSGEGSLLSLLAQPEAENHGQRLLQELAWQPVVDTRLLASRTGLRPVAVDAGLGWLGASGRLGYDVAESAYFHRELPIEAEKILRRNPRLGSARKLLAGGGVRESSDGWLVDGSHGETYRLTGEPLSCTCAWEQEHHGTRGPCKHVLAVEISRR